MYDYTIVGGGIVGLSTAWALSRRNPSARLLLLEKEDAWAAHQTGRNSGVIHSGIYYKPGSLKARLSREGNAAMVAFCREHGIPHETCGKVIVAVAPHELPLLQNLHRRGLENGLQVEELSAGQVRDIEPHVRCLQGLRVPSTGIVDYRAVCRKLADLVARNGGDLRLNTPVTRIVSSGGSLVVHSPAGEFPTRFLINCAGLHSDRVARLAGDQPPSRIVPFRGEYYELRPDRRHLVRHLIYPVPNPEFPFLGVHFTRMIDGSIHAGPNAVLSFKREGYRRTDFNPRDFLEVMTFPGFWKLAAKHAREGLKEMHRSVSKAAFVRSLQQLIPDIQAGDLVPSQAGVRAQALRPDGALVDDFLFVRANHTLHVINAPSPAATACLTIADAIVQQTPEP
ncbi:MAG: L-2-hydroxyglutarate oxidase [Verrucomicrobiae bacterium]|nr:L-2-hydroxyglutarate oxidase [Verrucomicrobiae bacterium]